MSFTPDSLEIQNFISSYKFKTIQLSEKSVKFIKVIYDVLRNADKKKHIPVIESTNIKHNLELLDNSLTNIKNDVESIYQKEFSFEFKIDKRQFKIHMFFSKQSKNGECTKICQQNIHRIYCWLYIANHFAKNNDGRILDIYIYFTDHKKMKPNKYDIFDSVHINTAYTYSCKTNTQIQIFRKEEWFKVLIHETFHSMGLDFACSDNSLIESMISSIYPVKNYDIRVYEAYCEIWAEIINVLFISFFSTRKKEDFAFVMKKTTKMISNEIHFSLYQMNKALKNQDLCYMDLTNNTTSYKENTYVLSYYVIKTLLYNFLNRFFEWCSEKNKSLMFIKTKKNLISFGNLIKELHDKKEFMHNVKEINSMESTSDFLENTMRMSIYEI